MGESSYAEWESGRKRPSRDAIPHLVALLQSEPEPDRETTAAPGDIVALVDAINALVEEMRLARQAAQPDLAEVIARSVEATLQAVGARAG